MPATPAEVARTFARFLFCDLEPTRFREVRRRNASEASPLVCHSHDFCDANMVMEAAMIEHGATVFNEAGEMPDSTVALWNAAWDLAKARHLTARTC